MGATVAGPFSICTAEASTMWQVILSLAGPREALLIVLTL